MSALPALATSPVAGSFALPQARAVRLRPRERSELAISEGQAWITLPRVPGDHLLHAGQTLRLEAGDDVVIEAWQADAPTRFQLDLVQTPAIAHAPAGASAHAQARDRSRQDLRELRLASAALLVDARRVAGALTGALASFAILLIAGSADSIWAKGRFFFGFWKTRARRAHGKTPSTWRKSPRHSWLT